MHHPATRANGQRDRGSFKKNAGFKPLPYSAMNFNVNQMPDNPGYMDFNDPTPVVQNIPIHNNVVQQQQQIQQAQVQNQQQQQQQKQPNSQRKKSQGSKNNKAKNKMANNGQGNNRNWQPNKFNGPPIERFGFKPPMGAPRGRPLPIGGPRVRPPLPPVTHGVGFPPRPHVRPPMLPMGRGGMPPPPLAAQPLPPPPFLRRSARGPPHMPPRPPMPPMMQPQRMGRGVPPIPFGNGDIGKNKKINGKTVKKVIKNKSTIKTLKNIVNQYPLDKPWVTDEIRAEHDKKVDIENRLKGNKNDELFAQFKIQRDKFVHLYEQAREEYTKQQQQQHKSSNDKNDANNKEKVNQTTELEENCLNEEAISN